jgi:SAM-dependent methyltransferase
MSAAVEPEGQNYEGQSYDDRYKGFESPLEQQLRREAYGQDIGQHSWVTAEDLAEDMARLQLARASRLLDLGCGPGGPLTYIVGRIGCRATGVDVSNSGIAAAQARAATLRLEELITLEQADLNAPLRFAAGSFNAVISLDVILHLRDRAAVFQEVARVLVPGGRFLFTDAGVITGTVSSEEIRLRSIHGDTLFAPPGFNEQMLELAGLRSIEHIDRTASLLTNAGGRLRARIQHRAEIEPVEGKIAFERQQSYLATVLALAERGAVSRMMYLAESRA